MTPDKARILCMDYHEIPGGPGHFTKIVSLENGGARWYQAVWCLHAANVRAVG